MMRKTQLPDLNQIADDLLALSNRLSAGCDDRADQEEMADRLESIAYRLEDAYKVIVHRPVELVLDQMWEEGTERTLDTVAEAFEHPDGPGGREDENHPLIVAQIRRLSRFSRLSAYGMEQALAGRYEPDPLRMLPA